MNTDRQKILDQINLDIIFIFLEVIAAMVSFYLINEKKKSALKKKSISKEEADRIYKYNRRLNVIICLYFFLNAYYSYKTEEDITNQKQNELLLVATFLMLIASLLYLPLGNSNIIIEN